ncbi:MAG: 16S rRNA (cytosine(967)-C(5))-methyltransferase RsmB [Eubacterium sp.]
MKNSRLAAFEILYDVFGNNAYSNIALEKYFKENEVKDKAFVTTLVYGVIERRLTLEYITDKFLNGRTKPKVKIILLMGAYQLYFMDKVPSSAAVNESVELSKQVGAGYYKNLINAVLHKIDSNRINLDLIEDLSVRYSCPQNLINMWSKMYGREQTAEMLESMNSKPPVFAVPNPAYVDAPELLYELNNCGIYGEVCGELVKINSSFDLNNCKAFKDGLFYIEDKSSYLCAKALDAKPGEIVLDVCAAPGGKTFTIASSMNNQGRVYSYDLHEHRVKLIQNGIDRLGFKNITAGVNNAEAFNAEIPSADKIICDVVCSGFGIIRRKPEIRYKNLDDIKNLPDIQYRILDTSSKYLKKGGRIIYSTCTLNKKENERVVSKFLDEHSNFSLIKDNTTFITSDGGDGFYYALMEKNND